METLEEETQDIGFDGGGGGAYASRDVSTLISIGQEIEIYVGNSVEPIDSAFSNLVVAATAESQIGGLAALSTGTIKYSGGTGGSGQPQGGGGGGGACASAAGNGQDGSSDGASAGPGGVGVQGAGSGGDGGADGMPGSNATSPGGGGGGDGYGQSGGGTGAIGKVTISYYVFE